MFSKRVDRGVLVAFLASIGIVAAGAASAQEQPLGEPVEIRLAVSSFATNATAAHAASGLAVQRVMRAVAQSGVQLESVEGVGLVLVPEYARPDPVPIRGFREDPRIIGYRAIGEVVVRTSDYARISLLLDFARGAGANELRPFELP
jgi:uncharacterized protein YggE